MAKQIQNLILEILGLMLGIFLVAEGLVENVVQIIMISFGTLWFLRSIYQSIRNIQLLKETK